jgi:hypothetical protein
VTTIRLIQAAVIGPALGGALWLALVRFPLIRRVVGGAVGLAAHAAAWAVFWAAFRGDTAAWRGLQTDLLGATVVVAAELGIIMAVVRAEPLDRRGGPAALLGLAVSASALAATSYAASVPLLALFVPIPTLAAGMASVAVPGRVHLRGLIGLAAADVVALLGLSVLLDRTGTTLLEPSTGLGPGLLLAAAAIKAGAIPGVGTALLATTDGPGQPMVAALRGQGMALAALAGLELARAEEMLPLAIAAAAAVALGGLWAVLARGAPSTLAVAAGAGAALPFLALGLGGAVAARAFLVLFPSFLVAAATADVSLGPLGSEPRARRSPHAARITGAAALGVALASLLGLPPGGGFPGAWLTLSLGAVRGEGDALMLALTAIAALGLAVAAVAATPAARAAAPRLPAAIVGALGGAALLYAGLQPVRLGLGWWLRIESELNLPRALAASGAPDLPAIGGLNLLLIAAPAFFLAAVVVVLGGGLRAAEGGFVPIRGGPRRVLGPGPRWVPDRVASVAESWRRRRLGFGAALLLEALALALVVRLVVLAARAGFL